MVRGTVSARRARASDADRGLRSGGATAAGTRIRVSERDRRRRRRAAAQMARRRGRVRCAGRSRRCRSVGVSSVAPRPPMTYAIPPSEAAAACVVGAGRRPMRRTRAAQATYTNRALAVPSRKRAACDDERAAGRGDRGIANGRSADAPRPAPAPGSTRDDRVEPARPRVAADDVRRAAEHGGGVIGARRRQAPTGRPPAATRRISSSCEAPLPPPNR